VSPARVGAESSANACARTAFTALIGSSSSDIKNVEVKLIQHRCRDQEGAADQQNAGLLGNVVVLQVAARAL